MIITRPTHMQLRDWGDCILQDLRDVGLFAPILDIDWQRWGAQFLNNATLGGNIPNPYNFANWKEWAERFCEAVQ